LELERQCSKNEKYRAHIIQMLNDKEFVEHVARQKVGYIKNDEILFRFD
jgi:cell division protein FtsB